MLNFKTSVANGTDARSAVSGIANEIRQDGTQLVIFYASSKYDFTQVSRAFAESFPDVDVIGCTTAGEIGKKGFVEGHISALSIAADDFVTTTYVMREIKSKAALARMDLVREAEKVGIKPNDSSHAFAMVHIDGLQAAEEKVMSTISSAFVDLPVVGGSAGDDLKFKETLLSLNGEVYTDAALVTFVKTSKKFFIYKENIYVPTDKELKVTRADINKRIVYEFNGKPAAEEYARTIGIPTGELTDHFMSNPLGRTFENNVWITSPQSVLPDKSVAFYSLIMPNSTVKVLRPVNSVNEAKKTVQTIKQNIPDCKGIILFNCILRFLQFKSENSGSAIANEFASCAPFCGFSTYGEQINKQHVNQTLTLIAFGDSSSNISVTSGFKSGRTATSQASSHRDSSTPERNSYTATSTTNNNDYYSKQSDYTESSKSTPKHSGFFHLFKNDEHSNDDRFRNLDADSVVVSKRKLTDLLDLIETLWGLNKQQSQISVEYGETTDNIVNQIMNVSKNVIEESSTINQSYIKVNQIVDNIVQISDLSSNIAVQMSDSSKRVNDGSLSIGKISDQMDNISNKMTSLQTAVSEFIQQSEKIESMNQSINYIASQTNLLALNAAIEAARAGEHGMGFGVIAEEVTKLSGESSNVSKQISALIVEIKANIDAVLKEMKIGIDEVKKGMEVTEVAKEVFEKMLNSITSVSKNIEDVTASTEEISANAQLLSGALSNINTTSKENADKSSRVSSLAEGQTGTVLQMASLNQQTDEILNEIRKRANELSSKY